MSKTLADILGWEEGATYKYCGRFFKIRHDMLLSSITGEQDAWHLDTSVVLNELSYLTEAHKVETREYYLKHKFLGREGFNYVNQLSSGILNLMNKTGSDNFKTQFTEDEIKEIEASGFDLRNFEKVRADK